MWWFAALAMAGPPEPALVCPDGEPVLPPRKVRVCEKPFRIWARDVRVAVRANPVTGAAGVAAEVGAVELSDQVAKALRTQASAMCIGMMTAPCSTKDEYIPIVGEMPDLLVRLAQAGTVDEVVEALERAQDLTEAAEPPRSGAPAPAETLPCRESSAVIPGSGKHVAVVPAGAWDVTVSSTGGGVDGSGVLLRWGDMQCSLPNGVPVQEGASHAALLHELGCVAPDEGDSLWVINPQGGLLEGEPERAEVTVRICPAEETP